ncbi:MAG TPA: protein kinase, partial [Planctomycetaceae bacterium]|nr:protein kinase [Planctomycetaceae bacterium]
MSDSIDETDKQVCSTNQSANATDPNATLFETQVESPSDSAGVAAPSKRTTAETQPVAAADTRREPEAKPAWGGVEATQTQGPESRGSTAPSAAMATTTRDSGEIPRVLGDYELLEELGKGGMGIVFRARQRSVNRIVALKVIRPDRLADMTMTTRRKAIERFRTEAEAAARISHDNLVTVYEVGCEAGCHYFSMRYVEGSSLSDLIRKNPADNRQAAAWIEPVCRAVQAVHSRGILHRDLKPQNILLEQATGRTLLADFGLAKLADDDSNMTQTGEAMGTPAYMSPEQFHDAASVAVTADVYSLGATLYCLLSGRPPFQASSSMQTMRQVLDTDAVLLRQLNPAVDRDLETICMRCLEKDPARRYGAAEALADELQRYLDGRP